MQWLDNFGPELSAIDPLSVDPLSVDPLNVDPTLWETAAWNPLLHPTAFQPTEALTNPSSLTLALIAIVTFVLLDLGRRSIARDTRVATVTQPASNTQQRRAA